MTAFCINCDCKRPYRVNQRLVKFRYRKKGVYVMFKELYAVCENCGEELYVPDINDINAHERKKRTERLIK